MAQERSRLEKIARLYYIEDLNQRQIANKLSISMASVSRSLAKAKELGIVRITIQNSENSDHEREYEIEQRYAIRECIITPSYERIEHTYRAFASALSEMLPRVLARNGLIGVSWGETLKALGEQLTGVESLRADVIPVIGAMGTIETGIYPNSIARAFADRVGGSAYLVNAPAVLDSADTATALRRDSTFEQVRELWSRLDLVILGASGLDERTSVYRGGIFTAEELDELRRASGVAATNFLVVAEDGAVVRHSLSDRIVCLPEQMMRRTPHVIVVAGGASKAPALRACLRSGLADILITDAECGRLL